MSRWSGIEEFVEVISCGSFTAAARKLGVSTSHVSRQIEALERRLGTRLLYRTTRQVTPSEMGKVYFDHCSQLLEGFSDAESIITQLQTKPQGLLRITAPSVFGEKYVAPLGNEFMARYPELSIEYFFSNDIVDVVLDGFDLAIRTGSLKDSTLMAHKLATRKLFVCGSPDYLNREGTPIKIKDLHNHNCLVSSTDNWSFKHNNEHIHFKVKGRWHGNSGLALLDACKKGLGLAQFPDYCVNDEIANGSLISVLDPYRCEDLPIWAVFPYTRHISTKVRLFVDFMAENVSKRLPGNEKYNSLYNVKAI